MSSNANCLPDLARPARAWMRLPSGRRLDLINPSPDAWTDEDLAVRLARTFRWGGESRWPRPLSVAQHSIAVLQLTKQLHPAALSTARALRELLHDAEEAFLGFDCIGPLKRALGQPFADVSQRLMSAVTVRYCLPEWTGDDHVVHKQADSVIAATEATHVVGWSREEIFDVLGIDWVPLDADPLVAVYGGAAWEPWPVDVAAARFLGAMRSCGVAEAR